MSPLLGSILTGILLGASFPPSPFPWLGIVAFVPLLFAIARKETPRSFRTKVGTLYIGMFIYHGIGNWWVMSWQENTDPYLMASGAALWLLHPFFLMLPLYALWSIREKSSAELSLLIAPLAIGGFEWLHGQTDASYPWLSAGYSLVNTPFVQIADIVGVYGLSTLIAAVSALIAYAMHSRSVNKRVFAGLAGAIVVGTWALLGVVRESAEAEHINNEQPSIEVGMVQPSEDPWNKWGDPRKQVFLHQTMVDSARLVTNKPFDIVVWPETAIPYTIFEPRFASDAVALRRWVDTSNIALLTGVADEVIYNGDPPPSARTSAFDESVRYDVFNAAAVVQPDGRLGSIHHKSMLTPFAERLPFADQLTFAMSWIEWGVGISAWGKGKTREPLPIIGESDTIANVGTIICIESIYPEVAADMVNNGADVLCVITNDAWYNGTWGPAQHFAIAKMRAIEQRRYLFRCAMSGESGIIAPDGTNHVRVEVKPEGRGIVRGKVARRTNRTFYARVGDVVPPFGLVATLAMWVSVVVRSRKKS